MDTDLWQEEIDSEETGRTQASYCRYFLKGKILLLNPPPLTHSLYIPLEHLKDPDNFTGVGHLTCVALLFSSEAAISRNAENDKRKHWEEKQSDYCLI